MCGDAIVDSLEECDEGEPSETCSDTCMTITPPDAGCCSTGSTPVTPIAASGLVGMLMLRRRRRRK
jgi:uncharacterized protein (TIGR03382 family)